MTGILILIFFLIFIVISFFILLIALKKATTLRTRIGYPVLYILIVALAGQAASAIADFSMIFFLLVLILPAFSILTLAPFLEPCLKVPQLGKETLIGSILMTPSFLYYISSAVEYYGPSSVFLPFDEVLPFFMGYWFFYLEMLIITATIMGALIAGFLIIRRSKSRFLPVLLASVLLVISFFLIQIVFIGFFALFIYIALEKVPWPGVRGGIPLLFSLVFIVGMSFGVTIERFTLLLPFYDISLINLGIAAPAMVTLYPIIDRYGSYVSTEIAVVLAPSIAFVLLSLPLGGYNPVDVISHGLSMLPLNSSLLTGGSSAEVFNVQVLYVLLAAVVSGILYGTFQLFIKGRKGITTP